MNTGQLIRTDIGNTLSIVRIHTRLSLSLSLTTQFPLEMHINPTMQNANAIQSIVTASDEAQSSCVHELHSAHMHNKKTKYVTAMEVAQYCNTCTRAL